ncbi:MAG: UspA domain protein [Anaerolineales bacterium]|nr:UspA domain protein [Anaerolineales bacterium]
MVNCDGAEAIGSMSSQDFRSALADFHQARRQAALQEIIARLQGKSTELLSYEEVYRKLRAAGRAERGLRDIPLDAIVGSVGRTTDFTRSFLPRTDSDEQRWAQVRSAAEGNAGLPPIEVYQIGDAYFVLDGHHRVSVARQMGGTHIQAYVTEVRTKVPLSPEVQPDELIVKAEYAAFLENTRLDQLRPGCDLSVSVPGQYARLENHIEAHRYFMEIEQEREVPFEEAAGDWYDQAYLPVVRSFREKDLLRDFPGRTETDLYLWVSEHQLELREALGWQIRPEVAANHLAAQVSARLGSRAARVGTRILNAVLPAVLEDGPAPGQWRQAKMTARYLERLFADILVPVSGEAAGWQALEQALVVARREGAQVHGLHVVASESQMESDAAQAMQMEFSRRCEEADVRGTLAVEAGEVAAKICERALLADLVVLHLAHPPPPQLLARLDSGFRTIIRRSARPVLAVPGTSTPLERALLAYDGSPKAREALFVATYLADLWKTTLVVVTVTEPGRTTGDTPEFAREYLAWHEVQAEFVGESGPAPEAILRTAEAHHCDLTIMGGYGSAPVVEVVVGSSVDQVLREAGVPVLICR